MIDPGELALAVVGLTPVIKGEMPIFGVEKAREAAAIPAEIDRLARQLVTAAPEMPALARPHKYRALLQRLARPLQPAEAAAVAARFQGPGELYAGPFMMKVQQAYEHIRGLFPVSTYRTFAGETQLEPAADKVWRFFLELQVLDDPLLVLRLAGAGGLLASQVRAVRELYPTLSGDPVTPDPQSIDAAIYRAIAARRAEKSTFRLSPRTEYGLAVWFGRRVAPYKPPGAKAAEQPAPPGGPQPASQLAKAQVSPAENAGQITPQGGT